MSIVITLDGPAGAGKSSVAKRLARRLNIRYLDTGSLYRAIAYCLDKKGIAPSESAELSEVLSTLNIRLIEGGIFVEGEDVTVAIRSPHIDRIVSAYSTLPSVRNALLGLQREQAKYGDLVADGRDTGTVVFPEASIKFYLTATLEARAERRYRELLKKGEPVLYEEVLAQIVDRDRADSERSIAPLQEPKDSIRIDTSLLEEEAVVDELSSVLIRREIFQG